MADEKKVPQGKLEADLVRLAERLFFWRRRGPSPGRFRMMLRRMVGSFTGVWSRKKRRRKEEKKKEEISFRAGWYLFGFIAATALGAFFWLPPLGVILFGVVLLYLGTCLHEVRSPDKAFLFRMGKMIGELPAGWYLTIPHFWVIDPISMETQQIGPITEEMYIRRGTPITVRLMIFYKVADLTKALLARKIIQDRIRAVVLTYLKGKIGESFFRKPRRVYETEKGAATLLTERGQIEASIMEAVNKELDPDGYVVTGIELEDIREEVESEAARIRQIGHARGDAATALARPLKDNYPAALVSGLSTIGEVLERIFRSPKGGSGGGEGTKQVGSTTETPEKSELRSIAESLQKLTGGR